MSEKAGWEGQECGEQVCQQEDVDWLERLWTRIQAVGSLDSDAPPVHSSSSSPSTFQFSPPDSHVAKFRDMRRRPTVHTVKGIDNDELWKIIRRFDKQMYHVKATQDGRKRGSRPELEMDLVNAIDEEFSPDRLRSNIERLYITFVG